MRLELRWSDATPPNVGRLTPGAGQSSPLSRQRLAVLEMARALEDSSLGAM